MSNEEMKHREGSVSAHVVDKSLWELVANRTKKKYFSRDKQPILKNPYAGGVAIGVILFFSFFIAGKGLGSSSAYERVYAFVVKLVAPVHAEGLANLKQYLATSAHPLNDWFLYLAAGIILGGLFSGWRNRRLEMTILRGPNTTKRRRIVMALLGGIIVAVGAKIAGGCFTKLTIASTSVLGAAGWFFFVPVFAVGVIAAYIFRKEWM